MPRVNLNKAQNETRKFSDKVRGELIRQHKKQSELADYLGLPRQSLTCRLGGKSSWKMEEVVDACDFLEMSYTVGGNN